MPTLVIQIPDMPPVEHVLKEEAMTIGRMKGNSIALDHSSVSLSHAKLTRIGGDYFLKDLNSTNGTMLNGQSITEARLRDGDHVRFGEVAGRYHLTSATLPAQPGPATPAPGPGPTPAPPALPPPSASAPAQAIPPGLAAFLSKTAPPAPPPPSAPALASRPKGGFATAPTTPAKTEQFKKKKAPVPLPKFAIPVAAGAVGLVLIGLLVWKFTSSSPETPAPKPGAPVAQTPAKSLPVVPPSTIPPPANPVGAAPVVSSAPAPTEQPPAAPPDVPTLVQSLKSSDPAERRKAAATLNAMGADAKDAVPALRDALGDPDPEVRQWSALALIHNKVYDKGTVPILLELLHHENPIMRQVACLSLALIPFEDSEKPPVVSALTQSLSQDSNGDVRTAAASALKAIIPDNAPVTADTNGAQK